MAQTGLNTVRIATSLAKPLWVGQAPGDNTRLYVLEQTQADIEVVINGVKNPLPFLDLTSKVGSSGNERGLLGLAFDPDFANNKFLYVDYTRAGDFATVVERYTAIDGDTADPNSGLVIFGPVSDPQSNHNGGTLVFGPDEKLYIGLGDGGSAGDPERAGQDLSTRLAKILRYDVDPERGLVVPPDNPFIGRDGALPEIWAYGLRNPWRCTFDRQVGTLFCGDVGQDKLEEVDIVVKGGNYGWRHMEGFNCTGLSGCVCNDIALTKPVHDYSGRPQVRRHRRRGVPRQRPDGLGRHLPLRRLLHGGGVVAGVERRHRRRHRDHR